MDLTMIPNQTRPRSNFFGLIYGEGGTGKTQLALRAAHRLTAPQSGLIVGIEADGKRMEFHAETAPGAGDGFQWKPIKFNGEYNPLALAACCRELCEAADKVDGPVAVIIDGTSKFWDRPGGLKWRNEHVHARTTKTGKLDTFAAWQRTGEEEQDLYAAFDELREHAHLILCLEQANEYTADQKLIGWKPNFRTGLTHLVDFILRTERYLGQTDTQHDPAARKAARDVHRAIVEKTPLSNAIPHPDGTVDFDYPMATGTVFPDPGAEIVDSVVVELCAAEDNAEAEADRFIANLEGSNRFEMLEALDWVRKYAGWPQPIRAAADERIVAMGKALTETQQQNQNAEAPQAPPEATAAAADEPGGPISEARPPEPDGEWADLVTGSPLDDWLYTAEHLCLDNDGELAFPERAEQINRFADFIAHAKNQERLDQVKNGLALHASSLGIDIKTDVLRRDVSA